MTERRRPTARYAVDWTDQETWSRPPRTKRADPERTEPASDDADEQAPDGRRADPEAAWGHRRGNAPGQRDEAFFGYYLQAATIVTDEHGPDVPELVRRIHIASCAVDPPPALVPVLQRMHNSGIAIGDLLADSGYAYRVAEHWTLPVRRLGASPIHDLHPNDRGPQGTHMGAIRSNGNLYCPATPPRCPSSRRSRAARQTRRRPRTTSKPPSSPATSSRRSPAMTATAITASPAPPPKASSAVRCAPTR